MSDNVSFFSAVAAGCTAFALVAAVFVTPNFAEAAETATTPSCSFLDAPTRSVSPAKLPAKLAALAPPLDERDQIAALESVQFALSEVADGSSYVWHRSHGRLSGVIKPIRSHKTIAGSVCRTILVVLNTTDLTKKTEAIACRMSNGVWQIEG